MNYNSPSWFLYAKKREVRNSKNTVSKAFIKYCKKINTMLKSSHKARKTFATRLKEAGFSDNYLRRCLGHVDFSTSNWKYIFDSATEDEKYERVARALQ